MIFAKIKVQTQTSPLTLQNMKNKWIVGQIGSVTLVQNI